MVFGQKCVSLFADKEKIMEKSPYYSTTSLSVKRKTSRKGEFVKAK